MIDIVKKVLSTFQNIPPKPAVLCFVSQNSAEHNFVPCPFISWSSISHLDIKKREEACFLFDAPLWNIVGSAGFC